MHPHPCRENPSAGAAIVSSIMVPYIPCCSTRHLIACRMIKCLGSDIIGSPEVRPGTAGHCPIRAILRTRELYRLMGSAVKGFYALEEEFLNIARFGSWQAPVSTAAAWGRRWEAPCPCLSLSVGQAAESSCPALLFGGRGRRLRGIICRGLRREMTSSTSQDY